MIVAAAAAACCCCPCVFVCVQILSKFPMASDDENEESFAGKFNKFRLVPNYYSTIFVCILICLAFYLWTKSEFGFGVRNSVLQV